MKFFCIFICLFCLIGCASLSDIRSSTPEAMLQSTKPPKSVANCVYYECQTENDKFNSFWNRVDMTENDGIYHLSLISTGGLFITQTIPIAEITVKPDNNQGSILELRSHRALIRTGPSHALEYMEHCVSSTPRPQVPENK